ncbi:MAG: hypothetical protein K6B64_01385, partial [Acholeplasmatales bacterium]|nr:hypothetical protein [Acholeplasmatales bacterium]
MLKDFKYLFKHFKVILFIIPISIFLLIICLIPVNKTILIKGDTTKFDDIIEINNEYESKGSFSTIFIYSFRNTSLFQSWAESGISYSEIYDTPKTSQILSNEEINLQGKIQYNQSISTSIKIAYDYAKEINNNVSINYKFEGFYVTAYGLNSKFR